MNRCTCTCGKTKTSVIYDYYVPRLSDGEKDHEKLGWESREAQYRRFDILLDNTAFPGMSVLDVGCGLGNLLDAFQEINIPVEYSGIDLIPHMVEQARERYPDARWFCCDIFSHSPFREKEFDVVYASGIFNINLGNNMGFLMRALNLFFSLSKKYVVFNLLSDHSRNQEEGYFYYNGERVRQSISRQFHLEENRIHIISDYLDNDFTVILEA